MAKSKTIFRVKKKNNFFILGNFVAQDERLSLEARGLLIFLLSMPDNWVVCIGHLITISPAKRDKIRRILEELIKYKYIQKLEKRGEGGRFLNPEYIVYEFPIDGYFDHLKDQPAGNTVTVESVPEEPRTNNTLLQIKQLVQSKQVTKKTTTNGFIWSPKITSKQQESILSLASVIDTKSAQLLLDELDGNIDNVKNPVGYFRSLLQVHLAGNYIPAKALQTQANRDAALANDKAVANSQKYAEEQLQIQIDKFLGDTNE